MFWKGNEENASVRTKNAKTERTGSDTTLVDASAVIRGTVTFSGRLFVSGIVEGEIEADDDSAATLVVGEEGLVKGNIRVPTAVIGGRVEGDVHAKVRLELGEKARVAGKVFYRLIEMHEGAALEGELHCDREGDEGDNVHPIEAPRRAADEPEQRAP